VRRLLIRAADAAGRAAARLDSALLYISAGLCRIDDVRRRALTAWNEFLVEDDNAWTPMAWESEAADCSCRAGDHVLVVGCGSGRDLAMLLDRGCRVTGIDPAVDALEAARARLAGRTAFVPLVTGFFEEASLSATFDVIWFSWFCYSYIPESHRRIAVLQKAAALLRPGGRVVVSLLGPAPRSRLWRLGRLAGALSHSDWRIAAGDVFVRLPASGTFRYEHLFNPGEADREVVAANLLVSSRLQGGNVLILHGRSPGAPADHI
jgi:SAM-dependent methyltransferase